MKLTLSRIAELITASGEFDRNRVAEGYSIDSRTMGKAELFFAIKGERFDGHDYVESRNASRARLRPWSAKRCCRGMR